MARFDFQKVLKKHRLKHLLEVRRKPRALDNVTGCVVDYSDTLILLHRLDWDTFSLNGYSVIRDEDIRLFRFFDKPAHWPFRAAKQRGLQAQPPTGISVASLPELLTSAAMHYSLLGIQAEMRHPDTLFMGTLSSVSAQTLTIEELDVTAEWIGSRRFRLADITRIDFGGGYELALAESAPTRKPPKKHAAADPASSSPFHGNPIRA